MYMSQKKKLVINIAIVSILFLSISSAYSPADEIPTDKSVWVKIDKVNFSMNEADGRVKITIMAEGRASNNTDHCGIAFVTVYKNGTTDYNGDFIRGPINITGEETLLFIPINGSWQKWKFYNVAYVEKEKLGLKENELGNISSFQIWVRGYKDKDEKLWNQTNAVLTQVVKEEIEKVYGNKSEKRGNGYYIYIAALFAIVAIAFIYKKFK